MVSEVSWDEPLVLLKADGPSTLTHEMVDNYKRVVRKRWAEEAKRDKEPPIKDADIHHKLDEISDLVDELRDMIRSR